MKDQINFLALKALLLDTITHLKLGVHLSPNYLLTKGLLCEMLGQKSNISSKKLLHAIGLVYKDNGMEENFWKIIDGFEAEKFLK
jgi:hypothetical protein